MAFISSSSNLTVFISSLILLLPFGSFGFLAESSSRQNYLCRVSFLAAEKNNDPDTTDMNPLTKVSWYAVEAFGKAFGKDTTAAMEGSATVDTNSPPTSVTETMKRIQADNEREYFLSGQMDELIYDANCEFADPFVSFKGRDRFVENLQNLGSFITEYSARPLDYQQEDAAVETRFMVKLQLNLPWKPVLAWPWGVRCEIDPESNLIVLHQEKWDIDPLEGVLQIFRKPTTKF